jgi:short-subunit dehydrogenase
MMARGRGQIALIASIAGLRGLPYSPAYAASKAGVRVWGDGLRALLAPSGVDVSVVLPGFFVSDMSSRFKGTQMFRISAEETAKRIRRGLARRQGRIVTGQALGLLLRLCDALPVRLGDAVLRQHRFSIESE